jgi:predicted CopG family antitoxin
VFYNKHKAQAPRVEDRKIVMRVQARVTPEVYAKIVAISGTASLADTIIRLIEQEHARIATPAWQAQRRAQTAADDAVHRSIMAALSGTGR